MPLQLLNVDIAADFGDVIECQWAAYENPFQRFFRLYCPIRGDGPTARAEAIEESTARQLAWHHSEPEGHWIKVVDNAGKIAGASLWKIFQTDPPEASDEAEDEVDWHPEGEAREYATKVLQAFEAPRRAMATRPHVCAYGTFAWSAKISARSCAFPLTIHGKSSISSSRTRTTGGRAWLT